MGLPPFSPAAPHPRKPPSPRTLSLAFPITKLDAPHALFARPPPVSQKTSHLSEPAIFLANRPYYYEKKMSFPIRVCTICGEEFELRPDKPGFANRCPACSEPEEDHTGVASAPTFQNGREANAARRRAMRDLLYRKDT